MVNFADVNMCASTLNIINPLKETQPNKNLFIQALPDFQNVEGSNFPVVGGVD